MDVPIEEFMILVYRTAKELKIKDDQTISEGFLALTRAWQKFDGPPKKFQSYAISAIRAAMRRWQITYLGQAHGMGYYMSRQAKILSDHFDKTGHFPDLGLARQLLGRLIWEKRYFELRDGANLLGPREELKDVIACR